MITGGFAGPGQSGFAALEQQLVEVHNMKLSIETLLQLSLAEIPTWDEIELLVTQLDETSLKRLNELAQRIQSGCGNEEEARTEGTLKRLSE